MDCDFCAVFDGRATGPPVVHEDERVVVFVGRYQPTGPGCALVVPRAHVRDLHELGDDDCGPLLATVRDVSAAVQRAFGVSSTTVVVNVGRPAQSVPHLHVHVVPRTRGDGYLRKTDRAEPEDDLAAQAERLRRAFVSG